MVSCRTMQDRKTCPSGFMQNHAGPKNMCKKTKKTRKAPDRAQVESGWGRVFSIALFAKAKKCGGDSIAHFRSSFLKLWPQRRQTMWSHEKSNLINFFIEIPIGFNVFVLGKIEYFIIISSFSENNLETFKHFLIKSFVTFGQIFLVQ